MLSCLEAMLRWSVVIVVNFLSQSTAGFHVSAIPPRCIGFVANRTSELILTQIGFLFLQNLRVFLSRSRLFRLLPCYWNSYLVQVTWSALTVTAWLLFVLNSVYYYWFHLEESHKTVGSKESLARTFDVSASEGFHDCQSLTKEKR